MNKDYATLHKSRNADPHRPGYHFLPPHGWMNDPNGLIHFRGEYHLFYQYDPKGLGPLFSRIRWGHARSADLAHWEHLPEAMLPDAAYDHHGVWSGCVVDDDGAATALYTGAAGGKLRQTQCLATSADMIHWEKFAGNPVIAHPPAGVRKCNFRDPYVWRHGGNWLMAVGASLHGRGAVLLYSSEDLRRWTYLNLLTEADSRADGWMWECPSFFPVGDKWALIVSSIPGRTIYFTGEFDGRRFTPQHTGELDFGDSMYAPMVFLDAAGRCIMFGWLREARALAAFSGWQGAQTLPRIITPGKGGTLNFAVAEEIVTLRSGCIECGGVEIGERGGEKTLCAPGGDKLEIAAELHIGNAREAGLQIVHSAETGEHTAIAIRSCGRKLIIDRTKSSRSILARKSAIEAPLPETAGPLKLRIFLDASILEIFAGNSTCISTRIYPEKTGGGELKFFATGGGAKLDKINIWKMENS